MTGPIAAKSGQIGSVPVDGAGDDEERDDDGAGGAEGGEGAAGRPEALAVREGAGEEADADGVAGAAGMKVLTSEPAP